MTEEFRETPKHELFDSIENFTLEVFPSLSELESRMEEIRKSSSTEVSGFVQESGGKFGFYHQMSDRAFSSELPHGLDNSWHSHPDTVSNEAILDAEEIPNDLPDNIKQLAHDVLAIYKIVDESSPSKPSLIDLINITDHQRTIDRISMPGVLLEIRISESGPDADITHFTKEVSANWEKLVRQTTEKITDQTTEDDVAVHKFQMALEHYKFAVDLFLQILERNGFKKMDSDNWYVLLEKIGVQMVRKWPCL